MKNGTILLLLMFFFILSACKDQQQQDLMGSESLKAQTLMGVAYKNSGDFIPPTRERGKKRHNVRSYGAVGDGIHDDTKAFQAAIDSLPEDGGTVFVPPGTYLINTDFKDVNRNDVDGNCIRLRSNMHLELSSHAILKAKATDAYAAYMIYAYKLSNVEISGGKIIGEREEHLTTTGENGRGIQLRGCERVTIRNTHISNFWGDGISIGTTLAEDPGPKIRSSDVVIDDVISTGNRRQGLSIGPAINVQVWDSEFNDTDGTAPQCGIDIEPEQDQFTDNVLIQNCVMRNNRAYGILLWKRVRNVTIKNCQLIGNRLAGIVADSPVNTTITSNEIANNINNGLVIKAGVNGMSVSQNIFHENNGYAPRPATLEITGMSTETKKDIFMPAGSANVIIGSNFYK